MNAVRDKHDAYALKLQAAHHRKQALAFVLIQRRGRFIKDKKAAVMRQRAGQQNLLFFRQRAAVDGATYVEADVKLGQGLARQLAQPSPAKSQPRFSQPVEHDVFRDAQARDQRDVNLLLHQVNPQLFGVARRANAHRLIVNHYFAFVMGVRAAQHRHER